MQAGQQQYAGNAIGVDAPRPSIAGALGALEATQSITDDAMANLESRLLPVLRRQTHPNEKPPTTGGLVSVSADSEVQDRIGAAQNRVTNINNRIGALLERLDI